MYVTSRSPEPLGPDAAGSVAERDEPFGHRLDEARRPAHEDARVLRRRIGDVAEQIEVDPAGVALPARRLRARESLRDVCADVLELVAVDDVVDRPRRGEQPGGN